MADHGQNGTNGHGLDVPITHDGSSTPSAFALPELFFKARCAAPSCRALLGGFHVPSVGGMVVFSCAHCEHTTVFKIESYQIKHVLVGPLTGSKKCAPVSTRKRQGK